MAVGEQRPFPMALSYPGCIKPNAVNQAAMNTAILDFWTYYRTKYIKATTTFAGGYYVEMKTTNAGATDKSSSEANGYGMILSVLLAGGAGEPEPALEAVLLAYGGAFATARAGRQLVHEALRLHGGRRLVDQRAATARAESGPDQQRCATRADRRTAAP